MAETTDFRQWHYLRPLTSTTTPANLMFFDTETYPVLDSINPNRERHYLRLWTATAMRYDKGHVSRKETCQGNAKDAFWDMVKSRVDKKRPLWLFCHNAGFDLTVLGFWDKVLAGDFEFQQSESPNGMATTQENRKSWNGIAVLNDPPTIIKCRLPGTKTTIVIVDTFNYFRCSLKELGESIGCGKAEMPPYNAPDEVWLDYCRQDVAVLEKAVLALIDLVRLEGLGKFSYTVSGQAINAYKARFMPPETPILIHGNRQAIQLERASYHGGAVHCWFLGSVTDANSAAMIEVFGGDSRAIVTGPVYVLDKNSFYPSIMQKQHFPYRLDKIYICPSMSQLESAMETGGVIAAVGLDCQAPGFPVTRQGKTFYAVGKLRTTLAYPELKRALQEGAVKKLWAMATYKVAPLFSDFVSSMFDLRKRYNLEGNRSFAFMVKCLMNSLYGRFGMRAYKWENDANAIPPIPFGYWWEQSSRSDTLQVYRSLCWLPQRQCTSDCPESGCNARECINPGHCQKNPLEYIDSFPAIPAYVTSYGREEILRLAAIAGVDNCLYSDTDSLHVTGNGRANLGMANEINSIAIGKLKGVGTFTTAEYRGYKDYTLGDMATISGVKANAEPLGNGEYRQQQFQRLASVLAGNELDSIAVNRITVKREQFIPLGGVDESGRVLLPLLSEW